MQTNGTTNRLGPGGDRHLRTLWTLGAVGGMTDADLLARFVAGLGQPEETDAAELAFGALLDRHGGTVFRVARMILGDEAASLDASQATFLLLAQKARWLRVADSLAPWLAAVARRVALGARRARRRRSKHETAAARPEATFDGDLWGETGRAVLAEVERLPEPYRAAVVACHLDGLTQHAAAARLGWPVGTLQSRLDRGRRKLRDRLTRRGLAPAALGLLPPSGLNLALPPTLVSTLARAAPLWAIQAAPPGLIAPGVLALVTTTAPGTATMKLTAALTLVAALGVATTTTTIGPQDKPGGTAPAPGWEAQSIREVGNDRLFASRPTTRADDSQEPAAIIVPAVPAAAPRLICFVDESQLPIGTGPDWDQLISKKYPFSVLAFDFDGPDKQMYHVTFCPTYIVVSAAGKELARREGVSSTRQIAQLLNEHLEDAYPAITLPSDEIPAPAQGPGRPTLLCFADEKWEDNHPIDHLFGTLRARGYAVNYLRIAQVPGLVAQHHVQGTTSILIDENGREIARTLVEPSIGTLADFFNQHRAKDNPDPAGNAGKLHVPPAASPSAPTEPIPPPLPSAELLSLVCFPIQDTPEGGPVGPDLDQLARFNYPVRRFTLKDDRGMAERFAVKTDRTYLVVAEAGKAVERIEGDVTTRQLAERYNEVVRRQHGDRIEALQRQVHEQIQPVPEPTPGQELGLLCFTAAWSPPCQEMNPRLAKLKSRKYPVQTSDIDQDPARAQRYKIRSVPTYVLTDESGGELARTQGVMSAADLAGFYNQNQAKLAAKPVQPATSAEPSFVPPVPIPRPWETVVRIKNQLTPDQWGYGSGTVIASSPEQSIILTVNQIFLMKNGDQFKAGQSEPKVTVDLFAGELQGTNPARLNCNVHDMPAELMAIDRAANFALLRIRPGRVLPISPLVSGTWKGPKGMALVTTGCSHGTDATAWTTQILDPHVKMKAGDSGAFYAMRCKHQPAEGRSGGGLFTPEGLLVGICNFADPNDHTGLYRGPEFLPSLARSVVHVSNGTSLDLGRLQTAIPSIILTSSQYVPPVPVRPETAQPTPDQRLNDLERKLDRILDRLDRADPGPALQPVPAATIVPTQPGDDPTTPDDPATPQLIPLRTG